VKKLKKQSEIHIPFLTTSFEKISPLLFKLSHLTQSGFKHFPVYFFSCLVFKRSHSFCWNKIFLKQFSLFGRFTHHDKVQGEPERSTLFSKDITPGRNVEEQSRRGLLLGP
jgi:hypothetical protein